MNARIASLAGTVLLLTGAAALAGIIFVPVGGRVVDSGEVELSAIIKKIDIASPGLVVQLQCPGSPPDGAYAEMTQALNLSIDRKTGDVSGTSTATLRSFDAASPLLAMKARVSGTATCVESGGRSCGQLVLELRSEGVLSTKGVPEQIGLLRQQLLGSLTLSPNSAEWRALDLAPTVGGSEAFVQAFLDTMLGGCVL